ncbi:MAG: DNA recombination protein RmuC [Leptospirillia bacterium]
MAHSLLYLGLFFVGAGAGFAVSLILSRGQGQRAEEAARRKVDEELTLLKEKERRLPELESALKGAQEEVNGLKVAQAGDAEAVRRLEQSVAELRSRLEEETKKKEALQASESGLNAEVLALRTSLAESRKGEEEKRRLLEELQRQLKEGQAEWARLKVEHAEESGVIKSLTKELEEIRVRLASEIQKKEALQTSESTLRVNLQALETFVQESKKSYEEKMALLMEARETLSTQFKNLASEILEEKSQRFSQQNQEALKGLLDPVKLKLGEFQAKVEEVYVKEGKDRSALHAQVNQLMELNRTLSDEAQNLTRALKGSGKTQGNWGEVLLNNVLEGSGLRKGVDYETQESHTREDGSRAQPDVVIHLPEDRHLIIDSKVSLNAYVDYVGAVDEAERQAALKRHVDSLRRHIGDLSAKKYQALHNLNSIDFVLMFVPVEPAFMLAVTNDGGLFADAWEKNVLLVSPSTLLFVLRTVAHLWRQEDQKANAQEIARRGAEFYDRLSTFVEELQKVGLRIDQARDSYQEAWNKLCRNKGNVIRQAEMLKELGVSPTKSLPSGTSSPEAMDLSDGQDGENPALPELTRGGRRGRPRKGGRQEEAPSEERMLPMGESGVDDETSESV